MRATSNQYELQDVTLWPNVMSLDENQRQERKRIYDLIESTKAEFYYKNKNFFGEYDLKKYLDQSRDIYYPPKAGLHYSIPDHVVGIGLKVDPQYEDEEKWAVLYHGTKPQHVKNILLEGLRPGGGQAHNGTKDPWGATVPKGVYFSFWVNQSFGYTLPDNPIIMECFVRQVYVAPDCKGYAVSNQHQLSRILIPLKTKRLEQCT